MVHRENGCGEDRSHRLCADQRAHLFREAISEDLLAATRSAIDQHRHRLAPSHGFQADSTVTSDQGRSRGAPVKQVEILRAGTSPVYRANPKSASPLRRMPVPIHRSSIRR
jgi:hypothetical protein